MTAPAPPPPEPREHLATLLRVPYRELVRELYDRLADEGFPDLQPAHSQVFPYLREGPAQSTALAERAQITKQSMGYLIASLEERGYVTRSVDPTDRRARLVALTPLGLVAARAATRIIEDIEQQWGARLDAAGDRGDAATLRRLLERLLAGLRPAPAD